MRSIALNRKNALFAGHDAGAENWACLASLIETCRLNGVDPQVYLTDVLTKLVNVWPAARIDELMPSAWTSVDKQRLAGRKTDAFTYAELDEMLRGSGRSGAIGMSAIDGLIAALVALCANGRSASRSGSGCAPRSGGRVSCSPSTARPWSRS
jgi:hypothetical protein